MARKSIKSDAVKLKGETAKKAPPLPAGADQPTNYAEQQGHGGETRQTTSDAALTMTTQQGIPIADAQNSLKAGLRGPTLLEDFILREKIFHFDHERIPERVVHARGYGAHGVFELTDSLADYTRADVLSTVGQQTEVFVRFSTVAGNKGSRDLARDVRGFAVKMYTKQGNWDIVGNNIPVFFIQDAIKFPDLVHAAKQEPDRAFPQAQTAHDNFWDFASLTPEAWHMIMWIMSDRTIPRSFRTMEGFGVHTYRLIAADGSTVLVKFHWKPMLGVHSVTWEEALLTNGMDPDFHRRDLADAIEAGAFPEWELGVQVFEDNEEQMFEGIDLLDPTKLVPEELAPVQPLGRMTLNANPSNYFAETEQVAFNPANLVPGIDVTNDPLLQGRLFSYLDTQLTRLGGPNWNQLPINRPHAPVNDMLRDGFHQSAVHRGVAPYRPNSLDGGLPYETPADDHAFIEHPEPLPASVKERAHAASFDDHFSQARLFFLSLSEVEREHVAQAYTFELGKCYEQTIRERQLAHLAAIDTRLAQQVADGLGIPVPAPTETPADVQPSPVLSQIGGAWPLDGRQVGVVVGESVDEKELDALVQGIHGAGMVPLVIAPKGGPVAGEIVAQRTYLTAASIELDAVVVASPAAPAADAAPSLDQKAGAADSEAVDPRVVKVLQEMWRHSKAILALEPAEAVLAAAQVSGKGVESAADGAAAVAALKQLLPAHRVWDRFPTTGRLAD